MRLFKRTGGSFQPVVQERFADKHYESDLEEWIYHNPELIADDLMMIGRQVVTDSSKRIDLLALNARGDTVIIELKRAESPRDLVGQINEYVTAVGKWNERELERRIKRQPRTLEKEFRECFECEPPPELNNHQEAVVIVEDIDPDTLTTFRRQGIRVITFSFLKSAEEEYLLVHDEYGREPDLGSRGKREWGNGAARETRTMKVRSDAARLETRTAVFTEDAILNRVESDIRDAYMTIKGIVHQVNSRVEEKVCKTMVGFYTEGKGLVWVKPTGRGVMIWLRKGDYVDKKGKVIPEGWGNYPEFYVPATQLDPVFIRRLIEQANGL